MIKFIVLEPQETTTNLTPGFCYLIRNTFWNDWFKYQTLFDLIVVTKDGQQHIPGEVKIASFDMDTTKEEVKRTSKFSCTQLNKNFKSLSENYFSLGQNENYYETINTLGEEYRIALLSALRDIAIQPELIEKINHLDVYSDSVARYIDIFTIKTKFAKLAQGIITLTPFAFSYKSTNDNGFTPYTINFKVDPHSIPPTNLHSIIGRNGVGKTHCLRNMAMSIVSPQATTATFNDLGETEKLSFSKVISISFSVFDSFFPIETDEKSTIQFHYIGLKDKNDYNESKFIINLNSIFSSFYSSVLSCRRGLRRERWKESLETLRSDPIFAESGIVKIAQEDFIEEELKIFFDRLSSGHKIILLTITRLVSTIEERTLVLLDEPEAHLHPPLLSAFIRSLSNLLVNRNGVAIVATHSPVVLQEIPSSCAHILYRSGRSIEVLEPEISTFGESIGILTSEVFNYEVTASGFHALILKIVEDSSSYDDAINHFNLEIGSLAKALILSLFKH